MLEFWMLKLWEGKRQAGGLREDSGKLGGEHGIFQIEKRKRKEVSVRLVRRGTPRRDRRRTDIRYIIKAVVGKRARNSENDSEKGASAGFFGGVVGAIIKPTKESGTIAKNEKDDNLEEERKGYSPVSRIWESTVIFSPERQFLKEIEFSCLAKLRFEIDADEAEDVASYGFLYEYNCSYNRINTKNPQPLQKLD
ncbi:hypothetical protein PPACK8108_LOCUS629 [Phakopsora pachyrhizi]|uniref:Uncharacterized protein n=1 Tax=Phakopsora pachyrhizi TaxID=170000 RepID=A0AAV0AFN4_PHAPC|nr:hypothetical protein PPACK8108_LOCUS629 [Phakopsora pachyrhizi]